MTKCQRRMVLERRQRVSQRAWQSLYRCNMWRRPSPKFVGNHMRQVIKVQREAILNKDREKEEDNE